MKPKIIAFFDSNYIPVTNIWLNAIRKIGLLDQVCLVTLDAGAHAAFDDVNRFYRPLPVAKIGLGSLWAHRVAVLTEFLASGIDIINSDVDAIWLRNPWPDISACGASAVFSQGTYWPRDVHEKNKVVVCCGLFYLTANSAVQALLREVTVFLEGVQDDQIAMNRVIAKGMQEWEIEDPYEIPFRDTYILASRQPMRAMVSLDEENSLSVAVLPHHAFPRIVSQIDDDIVVAHPLSKKSMPEKILCLSDLGLWHTSCCE